MHINKLPKEIFVSIILFLDKRNKFVCIYVCREWHSVISNTNLYNELVFRKDANRSNKIIYLFQENEYMGKQVTQLELIACKLPSATLLQLPKLLPNLKILNWVDLHNSNGRLVNFSMEQPPQQIIWTGKI